MRKLGIAGVFLVCVTGCQTFTAQEAVSEPDPAAVKRELKQAPNDDVHAKAKAEAAKAALAAKEGAPTESATASHILIRYQGALRTSADVTRSKDEARALAESVVEKLRKGADWTATANELTEDPSGKGNGGKLGTFPKGRMVPEFDSQVFALKPGETSGVVETGFGFHIIRRE